MKVRSLLVLRFACWLPLVGRIGSRLAGQKGLELPQHSLVILLSLSLSRRSQP